VPAVAHVKLTWGHTPVLDGSCEPHLSRSPQYGVFICICWRANPKIQIADGRDLKQACADHFMITTAGYLYWRGRISSPDPSIRSRQKQGDFCEETTIFDTMRLSHDNDLYMPGESNNVDESMVMESAVSTNAFDGVCKLLNTWQKEIKPGEQKSALYPLPEDTDWQDIPVSIKLARRASILGLHLSDRYGALTPETINKVLGAYESNMDMLGVRQFSETIITNWNDALAQSNQSRSLPIDTIENLVFLPSSRIREITGGDQNDLAYILRKGEILVPFDDLDVPLESNEMYEVQAHEFTHLSRLEKDDSDSADWLAEAIAQKTSNNLADRYKRRSTRYETKYVIESLTLTLLEKQLGLDEAQVINMRLTEIITLINDKYQIPGQLIDTPFEILTENIKALNSHYYDPDYPEEIFQTEWRAFQDQWKVRAS